MKRTVRHTVRAAIGAFFVGGALFTTCTSQLRDAIAFGTRSYVLNVLLDPETILAAFTGEETTDGEPTAP